MAGATELRFVVDAREYRGDCGLFAPGRQPRWSPREDAFIAQGPDENATLTRLPAGAARSFSEVQWPAVFDQSGSYVYNIGRPIRPRSAELATVVVDAESSAIVSRWSGNPRTLFGIERDVAAFADQPVGALDGTAAYAGGVSPHHPLPAGGQRCIPNASGAA